MGKVITFYSFKGGVGRSFLLANVAAILARWNYRVLAIDWDLEAPGLMSYVRPWVKSERPGLVDLVGDLVADPSSKWQDYVSKVQFPGPNGTTLDVDVMTAGSESDEYFRHAQAIDWNELYESKGFGRIFEDMRTQMRDAYHFVLIDSRTGISDIGGVSTVQMPDLLVFLFTANEQSIDGATATARRIAKSREQLPYDREQLMCLPILSRFETRVERTETHKWVEKAEQSVRDFYASWLPREVQPELVLQHTRIPVVPFWGFGERVPVVEEEKSNSDPESVNYPMHNIAALLARELQGAQQLVVSRDSYIAGAQNIAQRAATRDPDWSLDAESSTEIAYVSAGKENRELGVRLARQFQAAGIRTHFMDWAKVDKVDVEQMQRLLKEAKVLVVLLSERLSEWQNVEIENFASHGLRGSITTTIVPVILTDAALTTIPHLLASFPAVDGRALTAEQISDKCVSLIKRRMVFTRDARVHFAA